MVFVLAEKAIEKESFRVGFYEFFEVRVRQPDQGISNIYLVAFIFLPKVIANHPLQKRRDNPNCSSLTQDSFGFFQKK